jgi:hypothetical protein
MDTGNALLTCSLCMALLVGSGCSTAIATRHVSTAPQRAFFDSLAARCGSEYPGRAIIAPGTDDTFRPAFLGMRIDSCTADEIRIAFIVDDDESRTWVLKMDGGDLVFTHEHVLEGDTLSSNSGWGGRAPAGSGTASFQHFPDHRWDPAQTPVANRSHWRMRLDPDHGQFVYYLDRGVRPAYRLVFHLGQDRELCVGHRGTPGCAGSLDTRFRSVWAISAEDMSSREHSRRSMPAAEFDAHGAAGTLIERRKDD